MLFKNTHEHYGIISILLHWLMAIMVIGLFFLGQYMVDLDYYDTWYQLAPWWHKSLGFSVFILLLIRFIWRIINPVPEPQIKQLDGMWQVKIAQIVHLIFYLLLLIICISGYFVSTAKGSGIEIFTFFEFPAIMLLSESQAELAATIHEMATWFLMFLLVLHSAAALQHHFINKDNTLIRMLKITQSKENLK